MNNNKAIDLIVLANVKLMEKLGISADELTSVEYHDLLFYSKVPERFKMKKNTTEQVVFFSSKVSYN